MHLLRQQRDLKDKQMIQNANLLKNQTHGNIQLIINHKNHIIYLEKELWTLTQLLHGDNLFNVLV